MEDVIRGSRVCRLGLCDRGQPYVVPLCFGYSEGVLYFHCAERGRKLDIIRRNPRVCVECDIDAALVRADEAAKFTMTYRSVIAFGRASIVTDLEDRRRALDFLMAHYAEGEFSYPEKLVARTCIIRIDIDEMTGKASL